ncbi:MAG: 3-phosphoglycerate dehydrogenase [Eubacterium sp.]|jgi:D-3-phosphoglycerate dehydrogenase|nr:3-phosphoglycerate dehydrogenase [Eubacterium sp.]
MYKIAKMNKIAPAGLKHFTDKYEFTDSLSDASGLILRSQHIHDEKFGENLLAIARAGTGVNNIPLERCADEGICVFNTPGGNSNSVKELVLAGLLMASRKIPSAIRWTADLKDDPDMAAKVEKGKSKFKGGEIAGKTLGVIGLGAVGSRISNAVTALGMHVVGYDAYLSPRTALHLDPTIKLAPDIKTVMRKADFITIHVPGNDKTRNLVGEEEIAAMKPGAVLMNYSRAFVCDEDAVVKALDEGRISRYVTDFATEKTLGHEGVITTPHLGASTKEAEDNCALMAADELMDFIENGNAVHAVNFPDADLGPMNGDMRIAVMTKGIKAPVDTVIRALNNIEIDAVAGGAKGDYGYVLVSTKTPFEYIPKIPGCIRCRVIAEMED